MLILTRRYLTDYHPHMPILEENITPDDCYKRSPLLFWTVIAIAARRFEEEPTLLASLSSGIKELLWRTVGNPPHSGLDLKAMVLICLWPFPTSSMSTDISYFVASIVKTSAMHVGVHKPFNMQDFSRVKVNLHLDELKDALATWAACFVAAERFKFLLSSSASGHWTNQLNNSTTACIGQPPLFVADTTLEVISQPISRVHVPRTLYEMSVIFLLCNKFHTAMAHGDNGDENCLPLSPESIRVFGSSASLSQPRAGNASREAPGVTGAALDMSVVDDVDNGWLWDDERHPSFTMTELDITSLLS